MDKKEVIKAANTLKNYCNNCIDCDDCIFLYNYYFCKLAHHPHEWELPEAISDEVSDNDTNKRIAELHREIELRDRYIKELEQQLAIKDSILKKQGVMIAELEEKQLVWHSSKEKPKKDGWYLRAAAVSGEPEKGPCIYTPMFYSNASWPVPFTEHFRFMAWAKIPVYEEANGNETY